MTPTTTEPAAPEELPASGPWLVWTLRFIDAKFGDGEGEYRDVEYFSITGKYDELTEWLRGYVRHGIEDRSTLAVRWSEPHSVGFVIRDGDGALSARATITAAESDAPPPKLREQRCCEREMSIVTFARSGDAPMLVCHECGHNEPRF
ncbi:hypothetical protein ACWF9G_22770 [Nocardia sp. NPDC055029]